MIYKFCAVAVYICLAVLPFTADAALISIDWQSAGDNLITQDTVASLEWLDLTATTNLTGAEVLINYSGWRYATLPEINSLFEAAGATGPYMGWSSLNKDLAMPLINLWGMTQELTREPETLWSSYAIFDLSANSGGTAWVAHATHDFNSLSGSGDWFNSFNIDPSIDLSLEFSDPKYGHALVRDIAPVPIPTTMLLLGTGLFGIAIARTRS